MTRRARRPGAFEQALAFSRRKKLFAPGARVVVGTGSGAASLGALGFLFLARDALGLGELAVAAVDLGGEADADAVADAGRAARQLGVNFYAVSAEPGQGPRAALRALAVRERFDRIALGHTREDAVTRVLMGLVGGQGIAGVRPLPARGVGGFVRPLLDLRDAEALELARTAGIEPVMLPPEPGVRPPLVQRVRAGVLPRLRVEVPGADDALLRVGREAASLRRFVLRRAEAHLEAAQSRGDGLDVPVVDNEVLLASAVAERVLARLGVQPAVASAAGPRLARMLRVISRESAMTEVVLGPGVVATYVPAHGVVAVRVRRLRRLADAGLSG